jgi:hypothetical protein
MVPVETIFAPNFLTIVQVLFSKGLNSTGRVATRIAMKHPLVQFPDEQARRMVEEFIAGMRER